MPTRIVTYVHRPKRPPRKRKAVALEVPAIVATTNRKRSKLARTERTAPADDPEADARIKAFFARMIRPRDVE